MQFNATIELKPSDLEELIVKRIEERFPDMDVAGVIFDVKKEYQGFRNSYESVMFKGVKVSITPKKK